MTPLINYLSSPGTWFAERTRVKMTENQCEVTAVRKTRIHVETVERQSPWALIQSKTPKGPALFDPAACFLFQAWPHPPGRPPITGIRSALSQP